MIPYTKLSKIKNSHIFETTNHIFVQCKFAIKLWSDLKDYCQRSFDLPISNPQGVTFGFFEIDPDLFMRLNHILVLYKHYTYSSRDFSRLSFAALLKNIKKVFDLEKISTGNEREKEAFIKK